MDTLLYLGKASLIIALFYGVYQFALKKETFFTAKRHFLLGGIVAAIVIPFIEFTKTTYRELPSQLPLFSSETLAPQIQAPEEVILFSWEQLVFIIYLTGVAVFLLRFLRQLSALLSFFYQQSTTKKNGYSYIETTFETAPFSFFKYIVYNPQFHTKDELQMILKHEEVHALQKHSIDTLLANLLLVFLWFNPLAWKYKKSMEENLEFIADWVTVQQTQALKQYQLALVKVSSTTTFTGLATNFHQSFIKKRIIMLNKRKSHRSNAWKLSIILPFLALFLWSFNVKEVVAYTEASPISEEPVRSTTFSTSETSVTKSNTVNETVVSSEVPSEKETIPLSEAISEKNNPLNSGQNLEQEIIFQISKNSTKEELDALQKELKNKGFTFNYSNVSYNSKQEITSITIAYKDANGNSGKYSVNSDSPINTIVISSEGTRLSVQSTGNSSVSTTQQTTSTTEELEERREEMQKKMELKRKEMELRHEEMIEKSKERREKLEEQSKEHQKRQERLQSDVHTRMNTRTDSLTNRFSARDSIRSLSGRQSMQQNRSRSSSRSRSNSASVLPKNIKQITKNTTEAELKAFKNDFKAVGISFSFSSIKRNDANEITKIKLKIDNNNGSIASSTYAKGASPINTIRVGADENTTLLSTRD